MKIQEAYKNKRKWGHELKKYYILKDSINDRKKEEYQQGKCYWTYEDFMQLYRQRLAERKERKNADFKPIPTDIH